MPDFLAHMFDASRRRSAAAASAVPARELERRIRDASPVHSIPDAPFLLIAEVKFAAPSAGPLVAPALATATAAAQQARRYAAGGAGLISVLTEPDRFAGGLEHLAAAAAAVEVPVLRKDFLAEPYQVLEARAAGASAVLIIIRGLNESSLREMIDTALAQGLAVLLEAFDAADLHTAERLLTSLRTGGPPVLVGLNTRNLSTLAVDEDRLASLAGRFPPGARRIAESGFTTPDQVGAAARDGYDGALVGTSLMRAPDPTSLCRAMIQAGAAGVESRRAAPAAQGDRACG